MNIKDFDLNLLNVFAKIYQEQNISRAAEQLGLSQPATSNALNRLRKIVGDPLFIRNSRGVTPTPKAEELIEPFSQALGLIQNGLNTKTEFEYKKETRTFNIAMSDYTEFLLLPKLMKWLTQFAPGVYINIRPIEGGDLNDEIKQGDVDFAIGHIPSLSDKFRQQRLFEETFSVIASLDNHSAKDTLTPEEFISLPHGMLVPRRTNNLPPKIKQWQESACIKIPNFMSLMAIVSASDVVAYVPQRAVNTLRSIYPVKTLNLPTETMSFTSYQYWHEKMHKDPAHIWMRQLIFNICQNF